MDDHLLLAAEEPEVAVLVGAGEVAGVEPALASPPPRSPRAPPSSRPSGCGCGSRSGRPPPASIGSPSSSRSAMHEAGDRRADRALPDLARGRIQRRQADLGHPVALDDREARRRRELGQQLGRDLVGAGAADPQRGEVAAAAGRGRGSAPRARPGSSPAPSADARAAAAAARGCPWLRATTTLPPTESVAERPEERADVRHRGAGQEDVARRRARRPRRRWRSSSAASRGVWVTPLAGPVLPEVKKIAAGASGSGGWPAAAAARRRAAREARGASRRRRRPAPRCRSAAARGRGRRSSRARARRRARLAATSSARSTWASRTRAPLDLERVVDLARGVAVVERRRDQPRPEAGEVVDDEIDPVRHQRGDPVARLEPEPEVAAGERARRPRRARAN